MADDVLVNKAATIERCVARAREEYAAAAPSFASDITRQDAAIPNIQRACEAALDMGQHRIRKHGLRVSRRARRACAARAGGLDRAGSGRRTQAPGGLSQYRHA